MKKFGYFLGSFLAVVGGIGALGIALAAKEYVIAVGTLCVCVAAFPTVKNWVSKLLHE